MNIQIITTPLQLELYGFGGSAINKDYVGTAFKLSGRMWDIVKTNRIDNKGKNIWVYDNVEKVFAGVELTNPANDTYGLEVVKINMLKYAYYKHIGPYQLIKVAGENMRRELVRQQFEIVMPYIEIYGHWTSDESKLETELLMCLK